MDEWRGRGGGGEGGNGVGSTNASLQGASEDMKPLIKLTDRDLQNTDKVNQISQIMAVIQLYQV